MKGASMHAQTAAVATRCWTAGEGRPTDPDVAKCEGHPPSTARQAEATPTTCGLPREAAPASREADDLVRRAGTAHAARDDKCFPQPVATGCRHSSLPVARLRPANIRQQHSSSGPVVCVCVRGKESEES